MGQQNVQAEEVYCEFGYGKIQYHHHHHHHHRHHYRYQLAKSGHVMHVRLWYVLFSLSRVSGLNIVEETGYERRHKSKAKTTVLKFRLKAP